MNKIMGREEYLIKLKNIEGIGKAVIKKLALEISLIEKLDNISAQKLSRETGISLNEALKIKNADWSDFKKERKELEEAKAGNYNIYPLGSKNYPELLAEIYDPPPVLYSAGRLIPEDYNAVALVGTRKATSYGRSAAEKLAYGLASKGITVVSGCAAGIDRAAHIGALKAKGRTLGVLGGGLDRRYPKTNFKLMEDISRSGALLSEFPCKSSPRPYNFPMRNRVISGLSLGVVVVEAPIRSGALITAYQAMEQNRGVYAVPGSIFSSKSDGCAKLIKEGAGAVTCVEDILDDLRAHLRPVEIKSRCRCRRKKNISQTGRMILELLNDNPLTVDKLHAQTKIGINMIISELTKLEMAEEIEEIEGKRYIKTDEL
ncbi:MAG: DNA-processing protein DprA [Elusimicrobiota bacterium]|nr:DNA-processing protein DprA [Elusimicrobiota bacterium]